MAGSVLEVQPGKQPSAAMPAHQHVTLGAKGVGQSAVTLGYVAVQSGWGQGTSLGMEMSKSQRPLSKK